MSIKYNIPKIEKHKLPQNILDKVYKYTKDFVLLDLRVRAGSLNYERDSKIDSIIKSIYKAFELVPVLRSEATVWRGSVLSNQAFDEIQIGDVVKSFEFGILSTTKNRRVAEKDTKKDYCLFKLILPVGTHAIDISGISEYPADGEVLLPSGYKFVVVSKNSGVINVELTRDQTKSLGDYNSPYTDSKEYDYGKSSVENDEYDVVPINIDYDSSKKWYEEYSKMLDDSTSDKIGDNKISSIEDILENQKNFDMF